VDGCAEGSVPSQRDMTGPAAEVFMKPMQNNRLIASLLCVTLACPLPLHAQLRDGSSAASSVIAPSVARDIDNDPRYSGTLGDVFGVYRGNAGSIQGPGSSAFGGASRMLEAHPLPDLGDGSGGALSPQAERKLGERVMREVRHDPDYLNDWLVRDYLNSVASKLAAAGRDRYIGGYVPDFDLFAVRDSQINAFSLPGGFIGVNSGLFITTRTESELASVIGHEMGHVLQRHIARMLSVSERNGYAALAGMLLGVLAGVLARSGDLGSAVAMGGQAFAVDNQLRFSRAAEREADRVGFIMLEGAGYDPYAMPTFFERMERGTVGDVGLYPYTRTHPLTVDRIADMVERARRAPYRQPRQSPEYGFVWARMRVLQEKSTSDFADIERRMRTEIDDQTAANPAANWYGVAFAQMLQGHFDDAAASLARARAGFVATQLAEDGKVPAGKHPPSSVSLDVLASEIARRAGRIDDALRDAQAAQRRYPESHAAIDAQLQALIAAHRFADAQAIARSYTRTEPNRVEWWRYLAQSSAALGDAVQQHRAQAESLALDGAWLSAIRQLREARDAKGASYYQISAIAARLREFEERYKEEREDDKSRS
jgi:beta-barrel assembly-enhancing protease